MWSKFSNTQKVIIIGIVVLLIVVLILRINVARLRGPYCQFEDAMNAGDIKKAVESYGKMTGSNSRTDRFNAEKIGIKYARIELNDYLNGNLTYERVSDELYSLQDTVLKSDKQIGGYVEKMEYWHTAEENYRLGNEAKEAGLYEEAIAYYEQVPEDYTYYKESQVAIEESKELIEARAKKVLEEAANTIDINEDLHTYLDAIKILDDYIVQHPDDNFIPAKREQFMDEYYNIQLKNIKILIEKEEDAMALKIARELKDLNPKRKEASEYIEQLKK